MENGTETEMETELKGKREQNRMVQICAEELCIVICIQYVYGWSVLIGRDCIFGGAGNERKETYQIKKVTQKVNKMDDSYKKTTQTENFSLRLFS